MTDQFSVASTIIFTRNLCFTLRGFFLGTFFNLLSLMCNKRTALHNLALWQPLHLQAISHVKIKFACLNLLSQAGLNIIPRNFARHKVYMASKWWLVIKGELIYIPYKLTSFFSVQKLATFWIVHGWIESGLTCLNFKYLHGKLQIWHEEDEQEHYKSIC